MLYGLFDGSSSGRALLGALGVLVLSLVVWVVALALLGVLAWAVMRSKAPAESLTKEVATK